MKRLVSPATLRAWACDVASIPAWLFDECVSHAGSVSLAMALVAQSDDVWTDLTERDLAARIQAMHTASASDRKRFVLDHWQHLPMPQRLVFTRLCMASVRPVRTSPEPQAWTMLEQARTVLGVLLHAHVINGRIDAFTLGVWKADELVPLVRLDRHHHPEIDASGLDEFVIAETTIKQGPIRTVPPRIVMALTIDAWRPAPRRKCGVDVRPSSLVRTITDVAPAQASTIADLQLPLAT